MIHFCGLPSKETSNPSLPKKKEILKRNEIRGIFTSAPPHALLELEDLIPTIYFLIHSSRVLNLEKSYGIGLVTICWLICEGCLFPEAFKLHNKATSEALKTFFSTPLSNKGTLSDAIILGI